MKARFLIDTSAIARMIVGGVADQWYELHEAGFIGICAPVELEFLRWVPSVGKRLRTREELIDSFTWCVVPEQAWDRALTLQDRLAETSQHRGASVVDLVVAVTAQHHRLTVLHDDRDYEAISRVTGLPVQRVTD
jgi:predicted nucleic acid-binding protein